jgi:hypothetical protein
LNNFDPGQEASASGYYSHQDSNAMMGAVGTYQGQGLGLVTYGALKSKKIKADKERVGKMLKELDPVGHNQRTTQKIKIREYEVTMIN